MFACIAEVLDAELLASVQRLLDGVRFVDGTATAGWHARLVKDNEQAAAGHVAVREAGALVGAALRAKPVFQAVALPRRMRPVLFARYGEGRSYGAHMDDALMGLDDPAGPMRTDVAVTVFLTSPGEYDGGELMVEAGGGEQAFKLNAGDVVAYPATTLHRVMPVTRGQRMVAVTWAQSLVRDAASREILFDLQEASRSVFEREGKSAAFDLVSKSYANLLRRWSET